MSAVIELSPLNQLLDELDDQQKITGMDGRVQKVEITRKGALQFELELGNARRWYVWEHNKPRELMVANDRKIPLAASLNEEQFAAKTNVLSYRPGRRLTLLDHSGHKARVLKGFRRGHLDLMIAKYECAHAAFSGRGINASDIIEYDSARQCLVMVYQSGERLRLSADTSDLFHHVGEALRGFQDFAFSPDDSCFDSGQELQVIDKRAKRLYKAAGQLPGHWQSLRTRLQAASEQLPPPFYGLAHRDLHDKQFIQHTNYVSLLDFDLMCKADVALDPANFLAHLVLRNLQGVQGASQRSVDVCGKKFLQGLARNEDPGLWERLRFYQASSFCRLALVYVLRPRWQQLVPALVTMGNRCLDDFNRIQSS